MRFDNDSSQGGATGLALARRIAADRIRRAHIDTGVAADFFVAAMRTDLLLVIEELGLLELADAVEQLWRDAIQATDEQ